MYVWERSNEKRDEGAMLKTEIDGDRDGCCFDGRLHLLTNKCFYMSNIVV